MKEILKGNGGNSHIFLIIKINFNVYVKEACYHVKQINKKEVALIQYQAHTTGSLFKYYEYKVKKNGPVGDDNGNHHLHCNYD